MNDYQETEILHGTGELGKSRSQKKRESSARQSLGEELASLAPSILLELELPEELLEALEHLRAIKKPEARRRQMQFIGRVMREIDDEAAEKLEERLSALSFERQRDAERLHQLEELRELLLDERSSAAAMTEVKSMFPQAQEKRLRHLIQAAQAEKSNDKPARAGRELFRYLRALSE